MAGLTLEQLQKLGAKPKGIIKPMEQKQGFASNLAQDFTKRVSSLSDIKSVTPETVLQTTGQLAGFAGDVIGETFRTVVDKIPDAIKKPIGDVAKSVLNTPLGQSGIKAISMGVDTYNEWKKGNPRIARDLEAVVNIGMLLPVGKVAGVAGKETLSVAGKAAGKAATGLEKGLSKQIFDETLDIIKPTLTKTEKSQALEAGRGVVSQKILPRKFEKITVAPTAREIEIANTVQGIVSKSKNPIDNIEAIQTKIGRVAESVKEGLKSNNTIFNKTQIKSALDKAKENSRVVFGSDKALQGSYNSVVDEMMRQIEKNSNNLSGLLQARKDFDRIIDEKFPNLLNNPIGDNAKQNAVRDVRRAANDFIADKLPEGNIFKEELRKQSLMYDAVENISKKTASAVDASAVKKAMTALRQNPLVAGVTGGILTYGALMGMFTNPVVIGTLVLGGTIKLGKTVVTSKILRQSLVSVLRGLEKAGKWSDANSIKTILNKIPIESGIKK